MNHRSEDLIQIVTYTNDTGDHFFVENDILIIALLREAYRVSRDRMGRSLGQPLLPARGQIGRQMLTGEHS